MFPFLSPPGSVPEFLLKAGAPAPAQESQTVRLQVVARIERRCLRANPGGAPDSTQQFHTTVSTTTTPPSAERAVAYQFFESFPALLRRAVAGVRVAP